MNLGFEVLAKFCSCDFNMTNPVDIITHTPHLIFLVPFK